jgi:hypothetical protein
VRFPHAVAALSASLLAALVPTGARADGAVLGADAAKVHVAVAAGTDRTTKWVALTAATPEPFVWMLPVARGSSVDVVDPAWLEAVDFVTAPRVTSTCGGSALELQTAVEVGRPSTAPAAALAHDLAGAEALAAPFVLDAGTRARLAVVLAAGDVLVLRTSGKQTATVRVVEPGTQPRVALSLLDTSRSVDVTLVALGAGRASTGRDLAAPGTLHWYAGTSDYAVQRDLALAKAPGAFVVESASKVGVFAAQPISPYQVPSLAERYFGLAAQRGLATGSVPGCVTAAATLAPITSPLLPACAPAATAGEPLLPCGPTATDRLACGSRTNDLALALSGQAPSDAWLTRFVGRIPAGSTADDVAVTFGGPAAEEPLLRVALGRCSASGLGSSGGGGSSDPVYSGGGCGGGSVTVVDGTDEGSGCDGSSAPSDSSSSDDCDSGGGSSTSSGDDCDSGSTSGGDDCDSGSGSDDCDSAAQKKHASRGGRSPVSRAVLGLAFLVLPLRRWSRRKAR